MRLYYDQLPDDLIPLLNCAKSPKVRVYHPGRGWVQETRPRRASDANPYGYNALIPLVAIDPTQLRAWIRAKLKGLPPEIRSGNLVVLLQNVPEAPDKLAVGIYHDSRKPSRGFAEPESPRTTYPLPTAAEVIPKERRQDRLLNFKGKGKHLQYVQK